MLEQPKRSELLNTHRKVAVEVLVKEAPVGGWSKTKHLYRTIWQDQNGNYWFFMNGNYHKLAPEKAGADFPETSMTHSGR